jgi:hypothetical protein
MPKDPHSSGKPKVNAPQGAEQGFAAKLVESNQVYSASASSARF